MFPLDLSLHTVTGHKDKNLEEPLKLDFFVGKFPSVETFRLLWHMRDMHREYLDICCCL